jgi:signal transduction histidine kinase
MVAKVGGTLVLAFLSSVVLLIIIGAVSYGSVETLVSNNERVNHTQEVLERLEDIRTQIIQVETDARGFLLTGDLAYRNAYDRGLRELPSMIVEVKQRTQGSDSHQQKFPALEEAVRLRLELLDEYVKRREVLGATVIPAGQSSEGKRRMDAVRAVLDEISRDERSLLDVRLDQSRQSTRRLLFTLSLSLAGMLALLCLVFYLAFRDIKARRLNEERLSAARDELEQRVRERTSELSTMNIELERSNRELQDFAFVASHDLQEPLRKIQAFGDRLATVQGPKFNEQGRDYLDRMQNAAGRMHTLINDLLTFSRVTTKAQPFVPTDLGKIAKDVLSDLETTIEQSGGLVEIDDLPTIDADEMQMRQLFQNLIVNALKFRKADVAPAVRVEAQVFQAETSEIDGSVPKDLVRLSFADNGIGFDEKYLDRIFTPFQRLHARNEYKGTGIGLAVCRKIVERHGGTLTAESTPGKGANFIATLPLIQTKEK